MKAHRVSAGDASLLDPHSAEWGRISEHDLSLSPTPITAQPSVYIQAKWKDQDYGGTPRLSVQAAHNGSRIFFRLTWEDETADRLLHDTDRFTDAAAVLFPIAGDAPLQSMGSPQEPVNAWFWRPDLDSPYSVTAQGTGTSRREADGELMGAGGHDGRTWAVVLGRSLGNGGDGRAPIAPGETTKVAFAVWQGANQERGGLKAVTLEWEPLEVEP